MRFSHFIKYNAVPEWESHYMDYNGLKDLIYTLQTDNINLNSNNLNEQNASSSPNNLNNKSVDKIFDTNGKFSKIKNKFFPNQNSKRPNSDNSNNNNNTASTVNRVESKYSIADDEESQFNVEKKTYRNSDKLDIENLNNHGVTVLSEGDNEQVLEKTFELEDFNPHESSNDLTHHNPLTSNKQAKKNKRLNPLQKYKFWDSGSDNDNNTLYSTTTSTTLTKDFNPYDTFVDELTLEKLKVDDFYKRTELKFYDKFNNLVHDLEKQKILSSSQLTTQSLTNTELSSAIPSKNNNNNVNNVNNTNSSVSSNVFADSNQVTEEEDEEDEDDILDNDEFTDTPENTALLHYSQFNVEKQKQSILKQSIVNLYIDLSQLKSFIELNKMGFSKITKKADKVLKLNIKAELIQTGKFYKDTYIFQKDTFTILSEKISELITFYSIITDQTSDVLEAKEELKSALHDHIVWERSNTWKDMLGLISHEAPLVSDLQKDDENISLTGKLQLEYFTFPLPHPINLKFTTIENITIPKLFFTWKAFKIAFIIAVTGVLLGVKTFNDPAQHRCMALVECVAFLWASEALPLHITAFLVPLLVVLFRVLKNSDTGEVLTAARASSTVLSSMWSSTVIILLAGFTLGEVLSQYNIAKVIASWLLAAAGTKPRNVLLIAMGVVFFLSMWISNVAAPVLTYSLLKQVLDSLEADQPFGKALVLGVAIAANIGGMSSPISSPQNIISMQYLKPFNIGWGQFFAVALPTGIIATLICWLLLISSFKINKTKVERFIPIKTRFTLKQWFIIVVTVATILLWCVEAQIESAFGSSGIIAVLPICIFFGSGLLTTKDFNSLPWSIVILAMGGTALGTAVSSSGLLATIARALQRRIENDTPMAVLCIFGALMLVVGTFVSHTVSAIIIIPLVQEVGDKLANPKAAPTLVFGCTLLASAGMGLASSGFPNVTAISMLDKKGNRYLDMGTFMSRGVPCSLIVYVCVITIGYGIIVSVVHTAP
ncbi:hypothetical protein RI543_000873 [Arxiozyma heterogenica]|uniref:SPX domain-containing protein n=1 Tax=Arxiozyma heterogenica TaxID=278026 RepID=A0AAN7WSN3_9SACH|nr:hypothetical protein RI543_000873 [Kazachstania heterogenica]